MLILLPEILFDIFLFYNFQDDDSQGSRYPERFARPADREPIPDSPESPPVTEQFPNPLLEE